MAKIIAEPTKEATSLARNEEDPLASMLAAIDPALRPICEQFKAWLGANEENSFDDDYEKKREAADAINAIAERLGVRFRCIVCGRSSKLACARSRKSDKKGFFTFPHGDSTHGGGAKLPRLMLIDRPTDGRRR